MTNAKRPLRRRVSLPEVAAASPRRNMPAHNEEKGFLLFRARAHDPGATPDITAVSA